MAKIKSLLGAAGLAAVATMASAQVAAAEDREFAWSITVGGTSDYVFRGISLSNEEPAAQGSIDFSYGMFYAGAWASNVDGAGFEPWELDLYVGVKPVLGPVTFDFAVIGYLYPDAEPTSGEYIEFKAAGSMEVVKNLTGGVTMYYTPSQDNYDETFTVEGSLAYALPQFHIFSPTISGGAGYTEAYDTPGFFLATTDSYTYWNVGLALAVEKFTMDFRYYDTDIDNDFADERFVFSAKVTLP